jgi:replicative DNA helicase
MSDEDLITRMVSCTSHIDGTKIATDNLTQEEESRVSSTATGLETLPIEYLPPSVATPALLIARLRALSSKYTVKAVFIDYLQLMKSGHKVNSKYEDVTNVSQELKGIARNFDIPVIALAQLSRACESRPFVPAGGKAPKGGDRRPMLSDLRDSGAIEQDSDIIAFIYRDDYYNKDPATHDGFAEFNVAKWRFGKTGTVRLMFDGPTTAFHTVKQP